MNILSDTFHHKAHALGFNISKSISKLRSKISELS